MSVVSRTARQKSWQIAGDLVSLLDALDLDREQFAAKLRALARSHGLESDEAAARHIEVSYRQYQRWLSGKSEPRASSLKQIGAAYDIQLVELLGEPSKSQLDRIERMLERLLASNGAVTPEEDFDDAVQEIEGENESGDDQPGAAPGPA